MMIIMDGPSGMLLGRQVQKKQIQLRWFPRDRPGPPIKYKTNTDPAHESPDCGASAADGIQRSPR